MIPWDPAKVHAHFAGLPGSGQIASRFAVEALAWWLTRQNPRHLCDVGAGIGTLTAIAALWSQAEIVAVEDDPWCLEQARRKLKTIWSAHPILWYDKIPSGYMTFDFLILDGPQVRPGDWACLERRAVVFVEGGRRGQRAELETALRGNRPFCRASWKPADRSKGYHMYLLEPTRWERTWFACVRLREEWRDLRARLRGVAAGKRRCT